MSEEYEPLEDDEPYDDGEGFEDEDDFPPKGDHGEFLEIDGTIYMLFPLNDDLVNQIDAGVKDEAESWMPYIDIELQMNFLYDREEAAHLVAEYWESQG